jgi:hypothetical protein
MRKLAILVLVILIPAAWARAQASNPSVDPSQNSGKNSDLTTLQGCLENPNGHYTLTETNGATHQLSGAANKLGHQVNRQIEVTGKTGIKTVDSTLAGAGSSAIEQEVFEVKSVKRIADVCK